MTASSLRATVHVDTCLRAQMVAHALTNGLMQLTRVMRQVLTDGLRLVLTSGLRLGDVRQ